MNTTTVILTTKPKKGGRYVSDAEILQAVRTVNARYANAKPEAAIPANHTSSKRRRTKAKTSPTKAK